MDSEKRNKYFGDMDSAFPRLLFFRRDSEFCPQGVWGDAGETQKYNSKFYIGAFVHHIIVSSLKGIHPRHPPREFPLGLRAPVLGMVTAQILGNEPFPFLVGERILLSPVRCLGSCSLREHSAERNRASPHPTAQTPLRFFNLSSVVSLSLLDFSILYHTGARL